MSNSHDSESESVLTNSADSGVAVQPAQDLMPQIPEAEQPSVAIEQASQPVDDAQNVSAAGMLAEIKLELNRMVELCSSFAARFDALETVASTTAKQVGFLPPQLRQMSSKVDSLTTSISEPRYHSVLLSVLGIYDLVDQVLRLLPQNAGADDTAQANQRRDYEVFRTQLLQILYTNGLSEIPTEGQFDPKYHRAVKRVEVTDQDMSDKVLELVRPGFRTEHAVLRYAEVVVSHYEAPQPPDTQPS